MPDFDAYFITEGINRFSFASLLGSHGVHYINLIHIDAEGYDLEIIRQIPFCIGEAEDASI